MDYTNGLDEYVGRLQRRLQSVNKGLNFIVLVIKMPLDPELSALQVELKMFALPV